MFLRKIQNFQNSLSQNPEGIKIFFKSLIALKGGCTLWPHLEKKFFHKKYSIGGNLMRKIDARIPEA